MPSVSPSHASIKPPRQRRRKPQLAPVLSALSEFHVADATVAETRAALGQALAFHGGRREIEFGKVWQYAYMAQQRLDELVAATPGLRRRCAEKSRELEAIIREAQAAAHETSGPVGGVVLDFAVAQLRRAGIVRAT